MEITTLPNEMIEHIFYFCEEDILMQLNKTIDFRIFHKKIKSILETRAKNYWNSIHIDYIASLMEPIMNRHRENMYFGICNDFMDEWHESDVEFCCQLGKMKTQDAILYLKNERDRLGQKYPDHKDLEGRPYFLNRYLMMSIREMYHIYLPPPNN